MVRHIIIWDFKDDLSLEQRAEFSQKIKNGLEGLVGVIEGLRTVMVYTDILSTSTGDIMLDSVFDDEAALAYYAEHPAHVAVKEIVHAAVKSRKCVDILI